VSNYPRKVLTPWLPRTSGTSGWYQLGDELWFRGDADPRDGWAGGELRGKLDAFDPDELIHAVSTLLDADVRSIHIDIQEISTLDPSSARSLALAARAAEARGGRLTVRNATESVTTTLEIIGLGRLLLPRVADHRSGR
jgi:anti-anti-sigma factor